MKPPSLQPFLVDLPILQIDSIFLLENPTSLFITKSVAGARLGHIFRSKDEFQGWIYISLVVIVFCILKIQKAPTSFN